MELKEKVVYGTTGVCVVDSIEQKKIGRNIKQYYVLKPVAQSTSTVFLPVDNEELLAKAHRILSVDEIENIVASVIDEQDEWVDNDAQRRTRFSEIISSGDRKRLLLMMRTLYNRRAQLSLSGKRLHISDERAFNEVQRLIFDEFSVVLSITQDDVINFLKERLIK